MRTEPLGNVDAAWLQMDRPDNTADVVAVIAFSHRPDAGRVRRIVESRLLCHARFRQRVVRSGLLGHPAWQRDPRFSLDRHFLSRRIGAGSEALQAFVGEVATQPLDPRRPLWRIYLLDDGEGGGAIVAKLHHCIGDGLALVALLLSLSDERPDGDAPAHRLPSHRTLAIAERPGDLAALALRDWSVARDLGAQGLAFARSLARMIVLPPDAATALSRPLSGRRRVAWSRGAPLTRIREAARDAGGTINDLLLAGLAGALRRYLVGNGSATEVRALVPVNLRPSLPRGSDPLGNRFGLVFLDLPVHLATAARRLEAIRARIAELKSSPDAVVTHAVLAGMGAVPLAVHRALAEFFSRKASLVVTNVPGPREPLHLAGRRIDELLFWVPHPARLGLGVSILSYAGEVRIGVRADEAVVAEPAELVAAFEEELSELRAA